LLEILPPSTTGVGWIRPGTSHCSRFPFSTLSVYIAPLLLAPGLVSSAVKSAVEPNKDRLPDTVIVIFQRIITTTMHAGPCILWLEYPLRFSFSISHYRTLIDRYLPLLS
jgi:hypothetical protein